MPIKQSPKLKSSRKDVLCPSCNEILSVATGRFGDFYYCPNQGRCKQKTISVNFAELDSQITSVPITKFDFSPDSLALELRCLENSLGELYTAPSRAFPNHDAPFNPDVDDAIYDNGDDFRPY
jgi:hypothetical protein